MKILKKGEESRERFKEDKKNHNHPTVRKLTSSESIKLLNTILTDNLFLGESRSCWMSPWYSAFGSLIPFCSASTLPPFHAPLPMLGANLKEECFGVNLTSFWEVLLCLSAPNSVLWAGSEASITPGSLWERSEQQYLSPLTKGTDLHCRISFLSWLLTQSLLPLPCSHSAQWAHPLWDECKWLLEAKEQLPKASSAQLPVACWMWAAAFC